MKKKKTLKQKEKAKKRKEKRPNAAFLYETTQLNSRISNIIDDLSNYDNDDLVLMQFIYYYTKDLIDDEINQSEDEDFFFETDKKLNKECKKILEALENGNEEDLTPTQLKRKNTWNPYKVMLEKKIYEIINSIWKVDKPDTEHLPRSSEIFKYFNDSDYLIFDFKANVDKVLSKYNLEKVNDKYVLVDPQFFNGLEKDTFINSLFNDPHSIPKEYFEAYIKALNESIPELNIIYNIFSYSLSFCKYSGEGYRNRKFKNINKKTTISYLSKSLFNFSKFYGDDYLSEYFTLMGNGNLAIEYDDYFVNKRK